MDAFKYFAYQVMIIFIYSSGLVGSIFQWISHKLQYRITHLRRRFTDDSVVKVKSQRIHIQVSSVESNHHLKVEGQRLS